MSARLTVIICQSTVRAGLAADLEETLVAELMMTPGFDATMIGPLESVEADGTDFLCLSSFNHSLVLLTWLPRGEAQQHWDRLGLAGSVIAVPSNGQNVADAPENPSSRRVFHIQLTEETDPKSALQTLGQLLASRQVKTVGIGGIGMPAAKNTARKDSSVEAEGKGASATIQQPLNVRDKQITERPVLAQHEIATEQPVTPATGEPTPSQDSIEDEEWRHLDKLVDDFEELDL